MQMDPPMAKFTKNDGIIGWMHCQECIFHTLEPKVQILSTYIFFKGVYVLGVYVLKELYS